MAWTTAAGINFVNQYGRQQPVPQQSMWKEGNGVDMTIGIPHTGVTSIAWAMAFKQLQTPQRVKYITLSGQPVDQARNAIVDNAEGSHIFFLDSDVVCPPDTIARLMKHNLPIVSGLYYRRANPMQGNQPIPGVYKWFPQEITPYGMGGHRAILQWKPGELLEVDVAGAGCLLVKREVFQKIPKSAVRDWYTKYSGDYPVNRNIPDGHFFFGTVEANQQSEDFIMMHVAKEYGFPTFCDTSVVCKHILPYSVGSEGFLAVDAG